MISDMEHLVDRYTGWIRDNTSLREVEEWVEITTPLLDRHNDCVQLFVRPYGSGYILTDHGYTIDDLEFCGCNVDKGIRNELLTITLNGFGVTREGNALKVNATVEDFALQKQNLLQAVLAVNDLHYTSRSTVSRAFNDDFAAWLDLGNIKYERNHKVFGMSGLDYDFDFLIPASLEYPQRLLKTISAPFRANVDRTICAWTDTQRLLSRESFGYAIFNDQDNRVSAKHESALKKIGMLPRRWTTRGDEMYEELAA